MFEVRQSRARGSRSRRVRFKLTSLDAGPHESSVRNPRLGLVFAIVTSNTSFILLSISF